MLEVTNVKNSIATMIEFRQLRFVKLARQHIRGGADKSLARPTS